MLRLAVTEHRSSQERAMSVQVGDSAPDFSLPDGKGGKVALSDFLGKQPVVLAFYPLAFTGG
jgi:peroxiredoxin